MPLTELHQVDYKDIPDVETRKQLRKMIDKLNDDIRQLDWLLNHSRLDDKNIATEEVVDDPIENGSQNKYVDFYLNVYSNSGMECFNPTTLVPDYHDTAGVVSNDTSFEGDYSLKLASGQSMEQLEVGGEGFADPDDWAWCTDEAGNIQTRITFRAKGSSGQIRCKVYQGENLTPLWFWHLKNDGTYEKISSNSNLDFYTPDDWVLGELSFVVSTVASGGKIRLRIDNIGATDVYLDAFTLTPDWLGKWSQVYKPGPHSGGSVSSSTYYEFGTADWDPSGVEFTLENLYTDMPTASCAITVESDGDASVLSTSSLIMVCKMVMETVESVEYYSKILAVPKGSSIPSTISGGKIQLKAICTGMVARAE